MVLDDGVGGRPRRGRVGFRDVLGWLLQVAVLAALLGVSAGRIGWLWGWLFLACFAAMAGLAYLVVMPRDPALAAERRSHRRETSKPDRMVAALMSIFLPAALLVTAGLDQRFAWTPPLPGALRLAALVVAALGYVLALWAVASNTFFSSVLRIQEERGHTVVSAGPYRFIRHPGYAGLVLFWVGGALSLGSAWALIPAALLAIATAHRTLREERVLREGLEGYADYAGRVRHRLVPGIW